MLWFFSFYSTVFSIVNYSHYCSSGSCTLHWSKKADSRDTHLSRMVRYTQKNELAKPHMNYESRTIMWYKTPNFEGKKPADFEKTHISVILYYKIDHFCPLKSSFHPFPAIWPNVWVWNSLLLSYYHLLVQVRHARSLFFPSWHQ